MFRLVLALALGVASAFVAPAVSHARPSTARYVLEELDGVTAPCGPWDPLGLADMGTEKTLAWYRAAEIKHGRVAMAATVGWILNEMGITFPGEVAKGVPFSSLGKGVDAWAALPDAGKAQIVAFVGILELGGEYAKPHYMSGGRLGYVPGPLGVGKLWDPLDTMKKLDDDALAAKRNRELNNGRLAMLSAAGFFAASYVDGSVPLLPPTW